MNSGTHSEFHLEDGSLFVPLEYVEAMKEECDARGGLLSVAQAQVLVEKWRVTAR